MSLHSRATAGVGALLALCVLTGILSWRSCRKPEVERSTFGVGAVASPSLHAALAGAAVIIILGSYLGVNYAKFHTFDGVPLKYYDFYVRNPPYLQMTGARQIHLKNIPTTVASYFGVNGLWLDARVPWVFPWGDATIVGSPAIAVAVGVF